MTGAVKKALAAFGLGTVGGGVARLILTHHDSYVASYGIDLAITRVCTLDVSAVRACGIPEKRFTTDWHDVVNDPSIDIVVELIGGDHSAIEIYEAAFTAHKHIVTANKTLLGRHVENLAGRASGPTCTPR